MRTQPKYGKLSPQQQARADELFGAMPISKPERPAMNNPQITETDCPMSNIDKQALREAAEKAGADNHTQDEWFHYLRCSYPATVLALLDELEAKDKRIAELEASHSNLREAMAGIHNTITGGGAYTPLAAILNASKRAYDESADAAGRINGEG